MSAIHLRRVLFSLTLGSVLLLLARSGQAGTVTLQNEFLTDASQGLIIPDIQVGDFVGAVRPTPPNTRSASARSRS